MLLKIGEFARLIDLPVRTVRYYSDTGLLLPESVDPSSGYRRYRIDQVERARQLVALKATGLSLGEIGLVLDDELSNDQFRLLLATKVADLEAESMRLTEQLQRARAHLQRLTQRMEDTMQEEVTLRKSEQKKIAFIREELGGIAEIAPMFDRFFQLVDPASAIGAGGNIYHYFAEDGRSIDIEAAIPVDDSFEPPAGVAIRTIESADVACLTHHGAFNRLHETHAVLLAWVDANGYRVTGPSYEWNLVCTPPITQDNESYVTAIEIEIASA